MKFRISAFVYFAVFTLFTACHKEESALPIDEFPSAIARTEQPCRLLRQYTTNGDGCGSFILNYSYNDDGLVEQIERISSGGIVFIDGVPQPLSEPVRDYIRFEYRNGFAIRTINEDSFGSFLSEHAYNKEGQLIKTEFLGYDGKKQGELKCKYDTQGHLVEMVQVSDKPDFKYIFQYEGDNLSSAETEILWSEPRQKSKYEFAIFDGHKNFALAIPGLSSTFAGFNNNFQIYSATAPSNFHSTKHHFPINEGEEYSDWNEAAYSYEYNEHGFPTLMKYLGLSFSFEYECE